MKKIIIKPEIYTFDIDASQHVSNISYIKWMEMGRNKLLTEAGMTFDEIGRQGFAPTLTHTEIQYKKALYIGDTIRIELFLTQLKKISGTIQFNFFNQHDELVAEGKQGALFFSLETKRPYRLTEEQRLKFTEYLLKTGG